jgi:hypothetical protein
MNVGFSGALPRASGGESGATERTCGVPKKLTCTWCRGKR